MVRELQRDCLPRRFSPTGYFVVDYGSHEIDNCYSVIVAYSVAPTAQGQSETAGEESSVKPGYNPFIAGGILVGIALLGGVLIWLRRKQ